MAEPPPTLSYAESLARDRVAIDSREGYLRVISPPAGSWWKVPRGYRIAIALLALVVVLAMWHAITGPTADARQGAAISAAIYAGVLLVVCGVAHDRARRSFVFELTDQALSMTRLTPWGPMSTRSWPRGAIGGVHIVASSGRLIIRVTGKDLIELWLGPNRAANERVAAALRDGLAATPAGPHSGGSIPDADMPQPMPPGSMRTAMLITAATLGLIGIVVGVFVSIELAIVVLLVAAIPAGVALGTQKKDFYP